ncbi:protein O-GlcNAcase [Spongiibacter taiwanensis]|uniref:beta-N-acetylglucosaminidase domain-containing protein n=1 Tax=Spongiibacter taiwanensis TaxID=1748242 RepID=UPI0020361910|nr:beta-N-acetylglucosaminidase domain-containing protein [Spongiibacter taiwanensis]USA43391.1 protein O-GlcNAcase [Spongiibacter taiwanensis]
MSLPTLMRQWQLDCYIYAPKGDASLRSHWQQPFSPEQFSRLHRLGEAFHHAGLQWGVGLSPAGLQATCNQADLATLSAKLASIRQLQIDTLWLLFDDLPAGNPELAANQLRVAECVLDSLPQTRIAVCPSYYSFDPILEEIFGDCPAGYFEQLNAGLPPSVDLLWTGNKVVSESISAADIAAATATLGRPPLLWDNYPVNDGRKTSRFLHLAPFSQRAGIDPARCRGHFSNPMNQFSLNQLALTSLHAPLSDPCDTLALSDCDIPASLQYLLGRDWQAFQCRGLDGMTDAEKQQRVAEYGAIDHPMAVEVVEWLNEAYRFDPNCLTE